MVFKQAKDKEKFEKAVKLEVQNIGASYSKEIDMLRRKLEEANRIVEKGNIQKANMQDNLKKAFMRGVCALNFEAMNILDPNGEDPDLA
jgi:centrosomal protein POC5